ncbi:MAG: (2Fe-2S)-binding protein [Candidatus Aminicenantes bacterium]|jgi:xanthine dehydrogenase YagT iron-sulfur-binding subunit|nr:(2Fe-2S)-binding protein [Candidatus Aminicenantes bacterium]
MENSRKKKKTVTRRAFLQSLSGGAVGAGVASRVLGKEPRSIQSGPGEMEVFSSKRIALTVNGKKVGFETEPGETLLQVLRDRLRLTGTKRTCNRGECGGCTVLLDGKPVYSCHILAIQAEGKDILTIEGLASGDKLHPVQQAFIDKDSYQCGFCTPGFIMSSVALLDKNKQPSLDEIKAGLSGNLCRCGNYQKIHAAVAAAADAMRRG